MTRSHTTSQAPEPATSATLWRCGGVTCPPGTCDHDDEVEVERYATGTGPSAAPHIVHEVLRSSGRPLPDRFRQHVEQRLGHDFADVRVHADPRASESARQIQARAYTVGRHIAFAENQFSPDTDVGRRLLVHELTHAAQHRPGAAPPTGGLRISSPGDPAERHAERVATDDGHACRGAAHRGGGRPMLWRRWEAPNAGECPADVTPGGLAKVVIDQENAQSVTLHWNDGSVDSGLCSTGKGHCCSDASTPGGVAGTYTESMRNGSNCTPITSGPGYRITDRYRSYNGWKFWSTFVASRGIALHQHHTVTGTPLSHGCVRMHEETAKRIFCGARQNRTRVEVRGYARPNCDEPELQREWLNDFRTAGRDASDGETPDVRRIIRSNRRETRRMLREAYGRELTDDEIQQGAEGRQSIPRCTSRGAEPTVEERRAVPRNSASAGVSTASSEILASSGFEELIPQLTQALASSRSPAAAERVVRRHGQRLWRRATARARGSEGSDDRPLYWARLAMARAIRQWDPGFELNETRRGELIATFEDASRGIVDIGRSVQRGAKRILISGFDPFGFDREEYGLSHATNPSASAALALDGVRLRSGSIRAVVESVVFPVRFEDFNRGLVERVVRPRLTGSDAVDMVMTISMGSMGSGFEIEEFAGRRRQGGVPDNLDETPAAGEIPGRTASDAGPEFLRTSLPASARRSLGRSAPSREETEVEEIPAGETTSRTRRTGPTAGSTSVRGSGGGFLSNEIFYRVALARRTDGSAVPVGHLHTPFLSPSAPGSTDASLRAARDAIVARVRTILEATLPDL